MRLGVMERDRLYMRLGVMVELARMNGLIEGEAAHRVICANYPGIGEELARTLISTLGPPLLAAGLIAPDEDPLDTALSE